TSAEVGEELPRPRGERLDVDDGLAVLERDIGDAGAIGRPRGREPRLVRRYDRLRVVAVGVGDEKLVTRPLLGDIGDAAGEHAPVTGQFLVDHVRDLVRGAAELCGRDDVGKAGELRLL